MLLPVKADIDKKASGLDSPKRPAFGKELDIEKYNVNILDY
jgi:hypothetical protein